MFYVYLLGFDLLNAIGHCNFEFVPLWLFRVRPSGGALALALRLTAVLRLQALPPLKYLLYTPTFHALHHSQVKTNFCLFMPLYDYVYGTVDPASDSLHAAALAGAAVPVVVPDAVFLAHGTEVLSLLHLPFACRGLAAHPWAPRAALYLLWPLVAPLALAVAAFGRVFTADKHALGALRLETWVTPAFGLQYFLPSQARALNAHIGGAIASADAAGVRVIGLGALNKAEALNGGGKLFVDASPALRVRVVHGNTLTAAAILRKIPADARRVFVTGATSKLGRAIALYLARRGVTVLLLTGSDARFDALVAAEPNAAVRARLVRAAGLGAGADVDVWIVGKHLSAQEQRRAPPGTTFHQFVVPPIAAARADCSYTELPAFRLPRQARGLRSCEMTMPRGCVHACHAGALVHALEGWTHHEVGAVPPERIDMVWEAAARHGFELVL
jgi:predicted amino acid dehydrogenase